jgi:hypothetical protein
VSFCCDKLEPHLLLGLPAVHDSARQYWQIDGAPKLSHGVACGTLMRAMARSFPLRLAADTSLLLKLLLRHQHLHIKQQWQSGDQDKAAKW